MDQVRKWGFLRETKEKAQKAGIDNDTGIIRTGLDEYLEVIFPEIKDWIHDKVIDNLPEGIKSRKRPDYRSKTKKLIIEYDGIPHYSDPDQILEDINRNSFYQSLGYKVVRIPYFIQLTNKAVKELFDVDVDEPLFDESIPSMGPKGKNTPAFLCYAGIERMAKEFKRFPEQYNVNISYLKKCNNEYLTGVTLLESAYKRQK